MSTFAISWSGLQWGTVGEWVSGLGALAAVSVSLWLVRRDRRRERRAFARDVEVVGPRYYAGTSWKVHVVNHSREHLHNLTVDVVHGGTSHPFKFDVGVTGSDGEPLPRLPTRLGVGDSIQPVFGPIPDTDPDMADPPLVQVTFCDSEGNSITHTPDGRVRIEVAGWWRRLGRK